MLNDSGMIRAVELELASHPTATPAITDPHTPEDDAAFDRALHRYTPYEAVAGSYHPGHPVPRADPPTAMARKA